MGSKVDENHKGIGFEKSVILLEKEDPDILKEQTTQDIVSEQSQTVATDGGLGLSGPTAATTPSDDVDQYDDLEDDGEAALDDRDETVDCPHCGEDTELRPEDHRQGQRYRCSECGGRYKWT